MTAKTCGRAPAGGGPRGERGRAGRRPGCGEGPPGWCSAVRAGRDAVLLEDLPPRGRRRPCCPVPPAHLEASPAATPREEDPAMPRAVLPGRARHRGADRAGARGASARRARRGFGWAGRGAGARASPGGPAAGDAAAASSAGGGAHRPGAPGRCRCRSACRPGGAGPGGWCCGAGVSTAWSRSLIGGRRSGAGALAAVRWAGRGGTGEHDAVRMGPREGKQGAGVRGSPLGRRGRDLRGCCISARKAQKPA